MVSPDFTSVLLGGSPFLIIILWLLGFYLQIVPVAVICIYPFRGQFKCSNRLFYTIIALTILLTSIIWAVMVAREYLLGGGQFSEYLGISDFVFILSLLLLMVIYLVGINAKTIYKLFIFLLGMNYGFAIEITNRVINYFTNVYQNGEILYTFNDIIHYLILNGILIIPLLKLMDRFRECFEAEISPKIWKTLTVIELGIIIFLMVFYELPYVTDLDPTYTLYIFISALFFFVFLLYYWIFTVIREERINERNQAKWEFLAKSYKLESQYLTEIRKVRHEIRHHLFAIQLYLRDKDYAAAEEYLNELTDFESTLSVKIFGADNLLNLLLSDYDKRMKEMGIEFKPDIAVANKIGMEDVDLIELISNLLDNAIEAVDKRSDNRIVELTIKQNQNFLVIECDNTYKKESVIRSGNQFISNKQNTFMEKHGIGIGVMKDVTRKYNGFIEFDADNRLFKVLINLCTPGNDLDFLGT